MRIQDRSQEEATKVVRRMRRKAAVRRWDEARGTVKRVKCRRVLWAYDAMSTFFAREPSRSREGSRLAETGEVTDDRETNT